MIMKISGRLAGPLCALVLGFSPALAQDSTPHVPLQKTIGTVTATGPVPSLAVLNADGATLADGKLVLTGLSPNSIVFADRPIRSAGHVMTAQFLQQWDEDKDSFFADPPNATVSVLGGDGSDVSDAVVVLTKPVLDGSTLTFDVTVLEGALAGSGPAAVFIDDFHGGGGFVPYALAAGDIAGAVVVVVKDGAVLVQKGYGHADVEARTPVDPAATLFRPGSVSKLFTWTAVMQLVEQGKLDLDADVNQYLDFEIPARDGTPVTLRQAMTHTTGFEEQIRALITADPDEITPLGDALKYWVPERIHVPGATPAYSNYATALAGYIVERVSGESFDDYIERHSFQPLGMDRSSFRQPLPAPLLANMS